MAQGCDRPPSLQSFIYRDRPSAHRLDGHYLIRRRWLLLNACSLRQRSDQCNRPALSQPHAKRPELCRGLGQPVDFVMFQREIDHIYALARTRSRITVKGSIQDRSILIDDWVELEIRSIHSYGQSTTRLRFQIPVPLQQSHVSRPSYHGGHARGIANNRPIDILLSCPATSQGPNRNTRRCIRMKIPRCD